MLKGLGYAVLPGKQYRHKPSPEALIFYHR